MPEQDIIPEDVIRLIMLVAALIVPGVIGALTMTAEMVGATDSAGSSVAKGAQDPSATS